ncbi:MAG TPA: ABC transporter permease [Patescibacteria group bacterium]|nr:ABC transporter permease [Patescibacteria group bacterium]
MESTQPVMSSVRSRQEGGLHLIRQGLLDIWSRRRLARYLVQADLVKKGSNTILGNVWWVLDPLLQMGVYVVFVSIISSATKPAYPLFIFAAILPWKWFASSVGDAISSVTSQERIIKQVQFPKVVLPVASVASGIVNFAFGLLPLAALILIFFKDYLSAWILLIPVVAAVQFVFTLAVSMFLSATNVFYRDVGNVIRNLLRLVFYLSPSLYSLDQVKHLTDKSQILALAFTLNPFTTLLESYRNVIYYGQAPDWSALAILATVSFFALLLGLWFFKRLEPSFAKVL